jgi:predicted small lipoprotein YifL
MGTRRYVVLALGLFLLTGCGQGTPQFPPGGEVATPPSASPTDEPTPTPSSIPSAPKSPPTPGDSPAPGELRLVGTFVQGVENCIVLRTDDGKTYEIFGGDPALVAVGSRVVVHGRVRTDMASTCMQGPIVQATSMQRA